MPLVPSGVRIVRTRGTDATVTRKDRFDLKKEILIKALDRNFEWAKRTNEISMQVKKWAIAFSTVFVGVWFSDRYALLQVQIGHYALAVVGIGFFAALDALQHYYSFLLDEGRFRIIQSLEKLPHESEEELCDLLPRTTGVRWSAWRKLAHFAGMFTHETVWAFYGGLVLATVAVLRTLHS